MMSKVDEIVEDIQEQRGMGVAEVVSEILRDKFNVKMDHVEVRSYSDPLSDLKIDELDSVELIMEMEKALNINIPDDVIEDAAGTTNSNTGFFSGNYSLKEVIDWCVIEIRDNHNKR